MTPSAVDGGAADAGDPADAGSPDASDGADAGATDANLENRIRVVGAGAGNPIYVFDEDGAVVAEAVADPRGEAIIEVPSTTLHVTARQTDGADREYRARTDVHATETVDLGRSPSRSARLTYPPTSGFGIDLLGDCAGGLLPRDATSPFDFAFAQPCPSDARHVLVTFVGNAVQYAAVEMVGQRPVEFRAGTWQSATRPVSVHVDEVTTGAAGSATIGYVSRFGGPIEAGARAGAGTELVVSVPAEPTPLWLEVRQAAVLTATGSCGRVEKVFSEGIGFDGGSVVVDLGGAYVDTATAADGPGSLELAWTLTGAIAGRQQVTLRSARGDPQRTWILDLPPSRRRIVLPDLGDGALPSFARSRGVSFEVDALEVGVGHVPPGQRRQLAFTNCIFAARP